MMMLFAWFWIRFTRVTFFFFLTIIMISTVPFIIKNNYYVRHKKCKFCIIVALLNKIAYCPLTILHSTIINKALCDVTSNIFYVLKHSTQSVLDMVFHAHVQNLISGVCSIIISSEYFDFFWKRRNDSRSRYLQACPKCL